MGQSGFQTSTPFVRFLASKGITAAGQLGIFRNIGTRLAREPEAVAPNSPMLPGLAEFLKVPLRSVQKFAEGDKMSPQFERKIRLQMERGTIPRGAQTVPPSKHFTGKHAGTQPADDETVTPYAEEHDHPEPEAEHVAADSNDSESDTAPVSGRHSNGPSINAGPFVRMCWDLKRWTVTDLSRHTSLPVTFLWRVSGGEVAPNHPGLMPVAVALGVPVQEIAAMQKHPEMGPGFINRAARALAKWTKEGAKAVPKNGKPGPKPGTSVTVARRSVITPAAPKLAPYNRLGSKRTESDLRQSARTIVATLNVAIMQGHTHMPNIPINDVYVVLQDYLNEKGVKGNLLVDPSFATAFDPK